MLKLDISVEGDINLSKSLRKMQKHIENRLPLMKKIGVALRRYYVKNMSRGIDPDGRALIPVAIWTRQVGLGAGESRSNSNAIPLLNTGMLRNSMGTVEVTKDGLEFGWRGPQLEKAYRMINGIAGRMLVKEKLIRQAKTTGNRYIRINTGTGWFTKLVNGGSITVHPAKRNFFFLGKKQEKEISVLVDGWVNAVITEQARGVA